MKILLIAQEPPLRPHQVVTGNAIRSDQLQRGMVAAGHEVTQIWHSPEGNDPAGSFGDRDGLRGLLMRHPADVWLVTYWELLDLMPFDSEVPLVLDFLAPRPLEQLFSESDQLTDDLHRLQINLQKVDLLLVGSETQKPLMLVPMLAAGFDLRADDGIAVVPLAAEVAGSPRSEPGADGWTLVAGGVNWPWRRAEHYWQALETLDAFCQGHLRLKRFGGGYRLDDAGSEPASGGAALMPYHDFSAYLLNQAHLGAELAEQNLERRYSQSFRSLEFLRHGLPLICNRYLDIAGPVERFEAGWLIDEASQLPELMTRIMDQPAEWKRRSDNALRLVEAEFNLQHCCAPLINWLQAPKKAARLPLQRNVMPAALGEPPLPGRLRRMASLVKWSIKRKGFLWLQKRFSQHAGKGVLLVTRGDLFPTDHGAAVKIVETARGLSRHGRAVGIVTDSRSHWWQFEDGEVSRQPVPWWPRFLSWPASLLKLLHLSKDIPTENAFLYLPLTDSSFFWRSLAIGKKIGAGVLQAEFPAYVAPAAKAAHVLGARVILVQHNVEYQRIRAQVPELTDEQFERYRAIEIDMCNRADAVICVSDNDRQQLATDGVASGRLHTIPHGVDLQQFKMPAEDQARTRFNIPEQATLLAFHGTFSYPPNLQALDVFANELLPRLQALGLECHVLAIGREPPAASPHPHIHLTGSVDSVAPWLKAADMAVVPLLEGGGTRMKIIDCFAAGIPVISTGKGIEGIAAADGRHALVRDDWDGMAAAIVMLKSEPERAAKLATEAAALAAELDWTAIAGRYIKVFEGL